MSLRVSFPLEIAWKWAVHRLTTTLLDALGFDQIEGIQASCRRIVGGVDHPEGQSVMADPFGGDGISERLPPRRFIAAPTDRNKPLSSMAPTVLPRRKRLDAQHCRVLLWRDSS
jgi:hypothetical protein